VENPDTVIDSFYQKFTGCVLDITDIKRNKTISLMLDAIQVEMLLKIMCLCDGGYSADEREVIEAERKELAEKVASKKSK
jgi:hypothetical protein